MATDTIRAALALTLALAVGVVGLSQAHAEMTIYQVENNPAGTDSGNEWLTLINTGERDTFDGYGIQTTHGRIASYEVPAITLDTCEYHRITFPKQTVDNEDDTVKLLKDGATIYETPVIKDTRNNDRFWTNPDVAAICDDPQASAATETEDQPPTEAELEQRIEELEAEIERLRQMIQDILDILNALLDTN